MSQHQVPRSSGRRRFLCAATATAVATTPLARFALAASSAGALRLGIVLPESVRYPALPKQLLAGFEACLSSTSSHAGGHPVKLFPIACGSGARAPLVAAGNAVKSGNFDLLTGLVDRNQASQIAPLLAEHGVPFVVSDMGADIVRARRDSPYLIRNSLGYWQTNYAMGQWAAAHLGRRAMIATDFLESGYDMVYAFRRAFEEQGGEISSVQVTGLPDGSGTFSGVADAIRLQRPDFVYAFYSGKRAEAFLRFYDSDKLSRIAPLAGAALLTEAAASTNLPAGLEGVITASPWAADSASTENAALHSAYRRLHGGEPGLFAMLGYETAQRIVAGIAALGGTVAESEQFSQALACASVVGPRGVVVPQGNICDVSAPAYVRHLSRSANRLANVTIAQLPPLNLAKEAGHDLRAIVKTGWLHPYLTA